MNGRCIKKGERMQKLPNNNINININFSVKQKTNCFVGKKIDNLVEVQRNKNEKLQVQRLNCTQDALQHKKKLLGIKNDEETKKKKVNKFQQYTPEKIQNSKQIREKTHKAIDNKRKSGKSMEALKRFKQTSSASKSISIADSQSPKKLNKKRKGSKASLGFQNSGIKRKLQDDKDKQTQKNSRKSNPQRLGEEDSNNIKIYMNEKKKQYKKQINLSLKAEKMKAQKIKDQLKKVEAQRKISTTIKVVQKYPGNKRRSTSTSRFPLFNLEDQNFDEEQQYNRLQKQAQELIHLEQDRQKKRKQKQQQKTLTKSTPKKPRKLVEKYPIYTEVQKKAALIIQRYGRGYNVRMQYANQLNLMNHKIQMLRNKIKIKDTKFWNEQSNNSIDKIENLEGSSPLPQFSNNSLNLIQLPDPNQVENSSIISDSNSNMVSLKKILHIDKKDEIQQLKRTLQQQNQRYKKLQQQNQSLKQHLKADVLEKKDIKNSEKEQQQNVIMIQNLRNQSQKQPESQTEKQVEKQGGLNKNLVFQKRELAIDTQNVDNFKKIMQAYQCSPRQSISASRIKDPNIIELFHKKELKLSTKYNKKNEMFDRMLKDHLVSPRTYNSKVIALRQNFQKQKEEIQARLQEAKRVAQYIQNLQEEELKENNQKQIKEQESSENQQPNNKWIDDLSEIDSQQNGAQRKFIGLKVPKLQDIKQEINEVNDKAINIFQEINEDQNLESSQSQNEFPKGFETNLTFIKEYCIGLCEYIRAYENHRQHFRISLATPISYDKFQFLKSYRTTLNNQNTTTYNSHLKDYLYPFFKTITPKDQPISRQVFEDFNQSYDRLTKRKDLKMVEEYYLECLLDAFNESLDYQRPASIHGEPMTWSSNSKHLKNYHNMKYKEGIDEQIEQHKFDQFFGVAIARVIQWGSCLCGFIAESLQMQKNQTIQFSEEQIQHVRENRMALMLEKAIIEQQASMIDSELEQTQVRLCLTQLIIEGIFIQALSDIAQVFN